MKNYELHTHGKLELECGLDGNHVIIDKDVYVTIWNILSDVDIKNIIKDKFNCNVITFGVGGV